MQPKELTKDFILDQVRKLQYLYTLKKEVRYAQSRDKKDNTESVAEHVFGMHIVAMYFLPLLDPERKWDRSRIYEMITLHDIDEIETGDVLGYTKTEEMRKNEAEAMRLVMNKSPKHMREDMSKLIDEYDQQTTVESRFVKAVDKFEPLVQIYNEDGKVILSNNRTTSEQSRSIKEPYMKDFPLMFSYYLIIHQAMIEEGFFS
jgi:putative hydrolase of HD superfamily